MPSRTSLRQCDEVKDARFAKLRRDSTLSSTRRPKTGGKGIRTPDLLIANETLYQLSYTPFALKRDYAIKENSSKGNNLPSQIESAELMS
jgi:hypothetical protein